MERKQSKQINNNYLSLFQDKIKRKFNLDYYPALMITIWQELVESCLQGYSDSIFELDNDLSIREFIEFVLDDPELLAYSEHKHFKEMVEEIDNKFKKVIQPVVHNKKLWWENIILKYACDEYVDQAKSLLNIDVERLPKE